jgi:hypothetical protein
VSGGEEKKVEEAAPPAAEVTEAPEAMAAPGIYFVNLLFYPTYIGLW